MTRLTALRHGHPLLFALYPVLLLYTRNHNSVFFGEVVPALLLVEILTLAGWATLARITRDPARGALITSAVLFVLFSFERNVHAVKLQGWVESADPREWAVLTASLIVLGIWVWFLRAYPQFVRPLGTMANVTSIILVLFLGPGLFRALRSPDLPDPSVAAQPKMGELTATVTPGSRPDIYFIVLDAYGRSDVLRELLGYDNRAWLDRMERKGFAVGDASTANYCQTALSVTATLNASYHDELAGLPSKSRLPLRDSLQECRIPLFLRDQGYKLVSFASGFGLTDGFPADQRLAPTLDLPEFDGLLLDMTPVWTILGQGSGRASHKRHRDRILTLFDHLPDIAVDPAPTFCLAHVVAPHPPFVFDANGADVSSENASYRLTDGKLWSEINGHGGPEDYSAHYRAQATYISQRVEEAVDQILARSPVRPIIIIQGDHGPGSHFDSDRAEPNDLDERMGILNLALVPDSIHQRLYPTITPVNTFRLICDELFGTKLGLLPDRNFYSSYPLPYQLIEVTDQVTTDPHRSAVKSEASHDH